jgi:hypothetical protein
MECRDRRLVLLRLIFAEEYSLKYAINFITVEYTWMQSS